MAERLVAFSDFSGEMLADPKSVMNVTVLEHPEIDQPRGLQIGPEELEALRDITVEPVILEVRTPVDEEPTRLVTTVDMFARLSGERPMAEVLAEAKVVKVAKRAGASAVRGAAPEAERDYTSLEWAGTPHKGKTSPEEAQMVRENLEAVNARLAAQGLRTIDPAEPEMAKRYGFEVDGR